MNTPEPLPQAGRLLRTTPPLQQVPAPKVGQRYFDAEKAIHYICIDEKIGWEIEELPFIEDAQPPKPPEPEQPAGAVGIFINAVAQVFNQASPFYGVLFIIGDIRAGKVHGFHMLAGGRKEFVTVDIGECFPIGVSKARSKDPCSPQWKTEHKIP